jgi:hypothetical protein
MKTKLPKDFKPLMWGYKFNLIDIEQDKRVIIVNTINYGNLDQWKWLVKTYGRDKLRKIIKLIPETEFRKYVLKLMKLLFNIKKLKYASRSAQIRAEKNI